MSSATQEKPALDSRDKLSLQISRERILELAGILGILLLAVWLRFSNLESLGYVNHYYTAGVRSMIQSWHNFFYVAAEPGGSVSIDKPPVGLWLQVISAYFLGINGFSVLLPQLLAGTISVAVLYHLVRRSFGIVPGMLAAFVLAASPIVVATDRNNTIDSTLILALLLAAWAFIKSTETGKLRFLLLGTALVGIGFNIKMLQAYLPLPAFYALYFLGSSETIWRKFGKLALAAILLLIVSLSWPLAVDLTSADQRPYVGSSSNNSELDLILGYNGAQRLLGMLGRGGAGRPGGVPGTQNNGGIPPLGNPPAFRPGGNNAGGNGIPPIGPGGMNIGQPGALRLFISPLHKEISWLLPFGLIGTALLAAGSRWRWPITSKHQALVLWGGWLITCVVFFSVAGFFHEYYLSMLGAPLAALVGIGIGELWRLAKTKPSLASGVLSASVLATIAFQCYTAKDFVQDIWWLPAVIAVFCTGLAVLVVSLLAQKSGRILAAGFVLISLSMAITPLIWSVYTILSASQNQSLPSSYSGGATDPVTQRDVQIDPSLLEYLQSNTQDIKYLLAVPSAMQGADYVIATGRPVLYMGGFNGKDQVVTAGDLAQMVSDGELRYVYWSAGGRGMDTSSDISSWVDSSCTAVRGFDTATQNASTPDGTAADRNNRPLQNMGGDQGNLQVSLYDCTADP